MEDDTGTKGKTSQFFLRLLRIARKIWREIPIVSGYEKKEVSGHTLPGAAGIIFKMNI